MFKNILIAYDGSDHARGALALAGDLARKVNKAGGVVWIVTVMEPSPWELGEPFLSQYIAQRTRAGQALLQEANERIGSGLEVHTELLFGTPAESILEVAYTRSCDLIVMGSRGLGLLEGLLLGSQAQKVISHARCPVLIVK